MKNPLNKRIKREIRYNFGRYFAIAAMLILTITVISSFLFVSSSVKKVYEDSHVTNLVQDGGFDLSFPLEEDELKDVSKNQEINVYENFYIDASVDNTNTMRTFSVRKDINLPAYFEGNPPEKLDDIAVDRLYLKVNNLTVGDTMTLNGKSFNIVGSIALPDYSTLLQNPNDMVMDPAHFGVALVSQEALETLPNAVLQYSYAFTFKDTSLDLPARMDHLTNTGKYLVSKGAYLKDISLKEISSPISYFGDDLGGDVPVYLMFFSICLVVMAFVFSILVKGMIEEEAPVIGALLASGYSKNELIFHYLKVPILVTFVSAIIGNVFAHLFMQNSFVDFYYSSYSLFPFELKMDLSAFVITTVLPMALVIVINAVFLIKTMKITPLRFLRSQLTSPRQSKPIRLPNFKFLNRFRLRVFLQNKASYIVLFFGMFLATLILIFAFILNGILDHFIESSREGMPSEYQYYLKLPLPVEDESAEPFTAINLQTGPYLFANELDVQFWGIQSESEFLKDFDLEKGSRSIYVSQGLLKKSRLDIGDEIQFKNRLDGKSYTFEIKGENTYAANLGAYINVDTLNALLEHEPGYFNGYFSDKELDFDPQIVLATITRETSKGLGDQVTRVFNQMQPILLALAIIIYFVVMYVLTKLIVDRSALAISYLKIFGYKDGEINRVYLRVSTLAIFTFVCISLPLENIVVKKLFIIALSKFNGYIEPIIVWQIYPIAIGVAMVSYFSVLIFHMRRVKKIEMSKALKNLVG